MDNFLDPQILQALRGVVSSSAFFYKDENAKKHYNLICAVMDRTSTCINFLNKHPNTPTSEEDFIMFMVFGAMLKDAVKQLFDNLFENGYEHPDTQFFKDICELHKLKEKFSTDDEFFGILRSLIFAHPISTTSRTLTNDLISCPRVLTGHELYRNDEVGLMLYTKVQEGQKFMHLPFDLLKNYLVSRYNRLEVITNYLQTMIQRYQRKWQKHKVNRSLDSVEDILQDIIDIMEERYLDTSGVCDLLKYHTTESTNAANNEIIARFRSDVAEMVPQLIDAIDKMYDENGNENACAKKCIADVLWQFLWVYPNEAHLDMNYAVEKVYGFLNDWRCEQDIIDGRRWANVFWERFAKKWVTIDAERMGFDEIKLLTNVACYFENKEIKDN